MSAPAKWSVPSSKRWYAPVEVGYVIAFTCLARTLQAGIGLGDSYGIWPSSASRSPLSSAASCSGPLNRVIAIDIVLIIIGVILAQVGVAHQGAVVTLPDGGMASGVVPGCNESR